jgi:hypothetical protein
MGSAGRDTDGIQGLTRDLDRRISEMRELLAVMRPTSTATALKALRDSFPDIPLDERVRVLTEARG